MFEPIPGFANFLIWERQSKDTIDFKKVYVDMAGDVLAGLMLSQIVFWYLPDKDGNNKLRVQKEGEFWLVKSREEWWDEVRLRPREVDAALRRLRDAGLVETRVWKFGGNPTTHIRILTATFMDALSALGKSERGRQKVAYSRAGRRGKKVAGEGDGPLLHIRDNGGSDGCVDSNSRIRNNLVITDPRNPCHTSGITSTETNLSEKTKRKHQSDFASLSSDKSPERKEPERKEPGAAPKAKPGARAFSREHWESQDSAFARDWCREKGWTWKGKLGPD